MDLSTFDVLRRSTTKTFAIGLDLLAKILIEEVKFLSGLVGLYD